MTAFGSNDRPMLVFHVKEMASSRVAGFVTRAVKALDRSAIVRADVASRRLDIEPGSADAADLVQALSVAGFTATVVASTADSAFAWVDSRNDAVALDGTSDTASVAGVSRSRSLLPSEALGPLTP